MKLDGLVRRYVLVGMELEAVLMLYPSKLTGGVKIVVEMGTGIGM